VGKRVRPAVAALLALAIAGLGHVYLRSWGRAAGWFTIILGSGLALVGAFGDPTASVSELPALVVYPLVGLFVLSAVDAYVLARRSRDTSPGAAGGAPNPEGDAEAADGTCPHCGREVDESLDFCHWCTEPLDGGRGGDGDGDAA